MWRSCSSGRSRRCPQGSPSGGSRSRSACYALTLALAPAVVGLVGIAVELLMRRTYGKGPLFGLLLTFGVAMVIEEAIRLIWGTRDYVLPTPPGISGGFIALDLIWSAYRFYAAAIAALVIGLTWLLIEKTPYGSIIKAGDRKST